MSKNTGSPEDHRREQLLSELEQRFPNHERMFTPAMQQMFEQEYRARAEAQQGLATASAMAMMHNGGGLANHGHAAEAFRYGYDAARPQEDPNNVNWKTLLSVHVITDFGPTKGLAIMKHVKIKTVNIMATMKIQVIVKYENGDIENEIKVDVANTEIAKLGDAAALDVMNKVSPLLGMLHV